MADGNRIADAAARRAADRAEAMTFKGKWRTFWANTRVGAIALGVAIGKTSAWAWRNMPAATRSTLEFVGFCLALGCLSVLTAWELNNSGLGWALIFASWGTFAWVAGVAVAGWSIWAHRQQKEHARDAAAYKDEGKPKEMREARGRSGKWFVGSLLCGVVTLFGVFSNLVSHSAMDADAAIELEEDRDVVRANIRRIERELGNLPKPSGVEFTRETLASYQAEATGWKMENLDADGACKADLKKRQRELCNLAADIRAELKEADEMLVALEAKETALKEENDRLDAMQPPTGAKHWQKMEELWNSLPGVPDTSAGFIQTWGVFMLSVFGLLVCFIGWDSIGERVERRKKT